MDIITLCYFELCLNTRKKETKKERNIERKKVRKKQRKKDKRKKQRKKERHYIVLTKLVNHCEEDKEELNEKKAVEKTIKDCFEFFSS